MIDLPCAMRGIYPMPHDTGPVLLSVALTPDLTTFSQLESVFSLLFCFVPFYNYITEIYLNGILTKISENSTIMIRNKNGQSTTINFKTMAWPSTPSIWRSHGRPVWISAPFARHPYPRPRHPNSTGLQISNIPYKAGDPVYEIAKLLNKTPTTTVYDTCNL